MINNGDPSHLLHLLYHHRADGAALVLWSLCLRGMRVVACIEEGSQGAPPRKRTSGESGKVQSGESIREGGFQRGGGGGGGGSDSSHLLVCAGGIVAGRSCDSSFGGTKVLERNGPL